MNQAGILISDKKGKLQCWKKHFSLLLNRPSAFPSDELQQGAATTPENSDVSCASPSEDEVLAALGKLKIGKVPGICNIAPEMLKAGDPSMVSWLTSLFRPKWEKEQVPEDWKRGIILPFYKGKASGLQKLSRHHSFVVPWEGVRSHCAVEG